MIIRNLWNYIVLLMFIDLIKAVPIDNGLVDSEFIKCKVILFQTKIDFKLVYQIILLIWF